MSRILHIESDPYFVCGLWEAHISQYRLWAKLRNLQHLDHVESCTHENFRVSDFEHFGTSIYVAITLRERHHRNFPAPMHSKLIVQDPRPVPSWILYFQFREWWDTVRSVGDGNSVAFSRSAANFAMPLTGVKVGVALPAMLKTWEICGGYYP